MKNTLFIGVMLLAIVGQASIKSIWVLHYHLNKAYYMAHCENKAKPMLHCDGKCYLKKRIGASLANEPNPNEPQAPTQALEIKDIQLFFETFKPFVASFPGESSAPSANCFSYAFFYSKGERRPPLKPPMA